MIEVKTPLGTFEFPRREFDLAHIVMFFLGGDHGSLDER